MAKDIDPAEGIGPYILPTRERINEAAMHAIAIGGEVLEDVHRPDRVNYADDPATLARLRKQKPGRHWTCSCGQPGVMLEIPPGGFPLHDACKYGSVRPKGTLKICIRCDAGHLMPAFSDD